MAALIIRPSDCPLRVIATSLKIITVRKRNFLFDGLLFAA